MSGVSNGLMNIFEIWMNRCVHRLLSSRAEKQETVLNQNIQAGQNASDPGKQKQICCCSMLDGFLKKKKQIKTDNKDVIIFIIILPLETLHF